MAGELLGNRWLDRIGAQNPVIDMMKVSKPSVNDRFGTVPGFGYGFSVSDPTSYHRVNIYHRWHALSQTQAPQGKAAPRKKN